MSTSTSLAFSASPVGHGRAVRDVRRRLVGRGRDGIRRRRDRDADPRPTRGALLVTGRSDRAAPPSSARIPAAATAKTADLRIPFSSTGPDTQPRWCHAQAAGSTAVVRDGDAPGRNRTCDLSLRRRTLYPLSYGRGEALVYPRWSLPPGPSRLRLAETVHRSRAARRTRPSSRSSRSRSSTSGVSGLRRGAPIERYDETRRLRARFLAAAESCSATIRSRSTRSRRGSPPPGEHAARAAVDAALHDLLGKLAGVPVWRLLGLRRTGPPTSWTVWLGDPDDMARRAERARRRFQRLKLKLGGARRARPRARARGARRHRRCRSRWT